MIIDNKPASEHVRVDDAQAFVVAFDVQAQQCRTGRPDRPANSNFAARILLAAVVRWCRKTFVMRFRLVAPSLGLPIIGPTPSKRSQPNGIGLRLPRSSSEAQRPQSHGSINHEYGDKSQENTDRGDRGGSRVEIETQVVEQLQRQRIIAQ